MKSTPIAKFDQDGEPWHSYSEISSGAGTTVYRILGIATVIYNALSLDSWGSYGYDLILRGWHDGGREELAGAYLRFVFALTIAMIVETLQAQPVYTAEILLPTYIGLGGTITVMSRGAKPMTIRSI
ncbi:hypothetical protein V491_00643 [Pseudogymnoascus sp. VKM F-3775]|nr:hypothetical protein V491_00643 [Pseudogymnoascus sp. VKM F-3775]